MAQFQKSPADDPLRLDRQVCFPLYAATNLIQRLYRPLLAPLGLTYSQYLVMLVLWEKEPFGVGEIGECLHIENGTLTPLLKRMEQAGLLIRERDRKDERRVVVGLTAHGRALHRRALEVPQILAGRVPMELREIDEVRTIVQSLVHVLADALPAAGVTHDRLP